MGFMKSWENFSRKFYNVFGSKLQGWYDAIDEMELPEEINIAFKRLCSCLPEDLEKGLLKWVVNFYKVNGKEKLPEGIAVKKVAKAKSKTAKKTKKTAKRTVKVTTTADEIACRVAEEKSKLPTSRKAPK